MANYKKNMKAHLLFVTIFIFQFYFFSIGNNNSLLFISPNPSYQTIDFTYGTSSMNGGISSLSSANDYVATVGGNPCPILGDFINGYDTAGGQSILFFTFNTPLTLVSSNYIYMDYYYYNDVKGNADLSRYLPNQDVTFFTSAGNISGNVTFTASIDSTLNNQEWVRLRVEAPCPTSSSLTINGLSIGVEMINSGITRTFDTLRSEVFALAFEGIGSDILLPIELSDFTLNLKKRDVLVSWKAINELNVLRYEIEHASPLSEVPVFMLSETINSKNNIGDIKYYNHIISDLMPGTHYFRIKQVGFNGSVQYSPIKAISLEENKYKIFPTFLPKGSEKKIFLKLEKDDTYLIHIISMEGQTLSLEYATIEAHDYYEIKLEYPPGIYLIQIQNNFGGFIERVQIN